MLTNYENLTNKYYDIIKITINARKSLKSLQIYENLNKFTKSIKKFEIHKNNNCKSVKSN